ncbi:hypothetical protein TK6N_25030 [Tetragenococcus koreensis]|nr:hypothetical protein TK6N_25030 [Tetragenococcus koreensis]
MNMNNRRRKNGRCINYLLRIVFETKELAMKLHPIWNNYPQLQSELTEALKLM